MQLWNPLVDDVDDVRRNASPPKLKIVELYLFSVEVGLHYPPLLWHLSNSSVYLIKASQSMLDDWLGLSLNKAKLH